MTDIQPYEPPAAAPPVRADDPAGDRLVSWARALHSAKQLGDALCATAFVPQHFRGKPEEAAAAILYGDEVGLSPGQALQSVYVVSGKPSLYARTMVALVLAAGHHIWTETVTPAKVVVCGQRRGSNHTERVEWTQTKAQQAGYTSNKRYQSDPESMLYARASGDVARRIAPDALAGLSFTVEELELGEQTTTTVAREPRKTVQRKTRQPEPAPEPELEPAQPQQPEATETTTATETAEAPEPAVEDVPLPEPEQVPDEPDGDGITSAQQKKMGALMKEVELVDRDAALAYVANVIDREVTSRKDLSKAEAGQVIDALEADREAMPTDDGQEPGF